MAAAGRFREVPAKILKEIIEISEVPGPGGSLLDILLGGLGGPEAVLPLARLSSGELGVKAVRDHWARAYARQLGAAES